MAKLIELVLTVCANILRTCLPTHLSHVTAYGASCASMVTRGSAVCPRYLPIPRDTPQVAMGMQPRSGITYVMLCNVTLLSMKTSP